MWNNIESIISKEDLEIIKEIERTELTNYLLKLLRSQIVDNLKNNTEAKNTKLVIEYVNNKPNIAFTGDTYSLVKLLLTSFNENNDFKDIVLNLARLNFTYSAIEIESLAMKFNEL